MNNYSYNAYGSGNLPRPQPREKESAAPVIIAIAVSAAAILFGLFAAVYAIWAIGAEKGSSVTEASVSYAAEDSASGVAVYSADAAGQTVSDAVTAENVQLSAEELVTDAYTEDLDDGYGGIIPVRIPHIELSGGDADRLNDEIYDTQYAQVEACRESVDSSGWPTISRMEYRCYVNGDILSLVCECENQTDSTEYTVYNISVSTGAQLSADDILAALGCSNASYMAGVENAVSNQVLELWNQAGTGDYQTQLAQSLASDNILAAVPYLGENGALHVIVKIWGFAGAECCYYDLPAEPAAAADGTAEGLFAVIGGRDYLFSSGMGAWSESITINTDGTFSGYTFDGDMGLETIWSCDFTGTFGNVTRISDYEYTIEVSVLDAPTFDDYTQDGMTYSYTAPYGISQGMTFHVYLPGMAIADMPSDYLEYPCVSWNVDGLTVFPCCGLYSTSGGSYCETQY